MEMRHLFLLCIVIVVSTGGPLKRVPKVYYSDNPAVQKFREYLQIDTSTEDLRQAVKFWKRQAKKLDLQFNVYRPGDKPICVLTWPGQEPGLPAIMLNSHMDMVPAEEEFWTYPPFAAEMNENGDIFARGAQDDKDVAIQYLEAIRRLKDMKVTLKRTLHMTLMPDEESGGSEGMVKFVKTDEFKALNIGFALDEGITSPDNILYVTYQDKRPWQVNITVKGETGHASVMPNDSAVVKIQRIINKINEHRDKQRLIQNSTKATDYGAYDSVNVNMIQGGFVPNVIPGKMSLVVDTRFAVNRTVEEMTDLVNSWIAEGGNGVEVEYIRHVEQSSASPLDGNVYWDAMKDAVTELNYTILPVVCPAASDMIDIRNLGIPALGFAPKTNTTSRIHGNDEYLNAATFLQGIEIYVSILKKIGNLLC